jgi:valyl-tRNA synthetase
VDPAAEDEMAVLMEVTRAIRHIRSEMGVPPGRRAKVLLAAPEEKTRLVLERGMEYLQNLAGADVSIYAALAEKPEQAAHAVARGVEVFVPLKGLIDLEKESARLVKELALVEKDLARVRGKLSNEGFLSKAPPEVVEKEKAKEMELSGKAAAIRGRLSMFAGDR